DCTFCYAARSMFDAQEVPRTRINVPRMFEVVEDMVSHGLRSATLIGSGEPTLHPEIATIIRGLKERGLDVGMFTNGSCVTDATADAIAECMTFVRFSFTGASKKVHDLVHANSDFDRVVENIRKIAARRKGQLPTLGSQFVLASYSAEDVVAGAELAKDMGLDYYEIKPAYVAPDKPNQLENTLSISEANAFMEEARRLEDDNFKVYAKAQQLEGVFNGQDDRPYNNCPGHQTNAVLEADLNLYFCSNHKTPDFCIGSVDKESFEDVWNGPRRREIIQSLNVHSCEPHCRMDPLNKIVHSIRVGGREIPMNLPKPDEQLHVKFL
ncbi:MAG: radical SAM protein, partial [Phycisphaerae bacterium]